MATNTKKSSTKPEEKLFTKSVEDKSENTEVKTNETQSLDVQAQLMEMMAQMKSQLDSISSELASTKAELATTKEELTSTKDELAEAKNSEIINVTNVSGYETTGYIAPMEPESIQLPVAQLSQTTSLAEKYIETMANRKSDKEVTIVHNRELVGGLTTHLELSNGLVINFRRLGEKRVLTWVQFEECASKYSGFFEREIILIADENRDVAELYKLPCVKRLDGKVLTRSELDKLGKMSVNQLTDLYNSLTENDKKFMLNYWLGQCYSRTPGFYDRHKIETLNTLSKVGAFDTFVAYLNGEALNAGRQAPVNNVNAQDSAFIGKA